MKPLLLSAFCLVSASVLADGLSVTSNVSTVKGWRSHSLMFDTVTGEFSDTNLATFAEATAAEQVAAELPSLAWHASEEVAEAAAPIHEALVEQKDRPIVNLFLSVDPDNANDRQNLTMVCLSNESAIVDSGVSFRTWWFANAVLTSAPIMGLKVFSDYNTRSYEIPGTWASYGTNGVTIVDGGAEYETYELDFTLPGTNTPHNLSIYLRPWAVINPDFDFGNRQRRHNGELCTTTNTLAFLGSFYYTNMTEITTHFPYADRGKLKWEEVKQDE